MGTQKRRAIGTGVAMLAAILSASAALAEKPHFDKPPLTFFPARSVIEVPPGGQIDVRQSHGIELTLRDTIPAAARPALRTKGFELRFFRIPQFGALPELWHSDLDGCDVYLSLVLKGMKFSGSRAITGPLGAGWLESEDGDVGVGLFLMVIEERTPEDATRVGPWEVFRVNHLAANDYFRKGVEIMVEPDGSGGGRFDNGEARVRARLAGVAAEIARKYDCYQVAPVRLASLDGSRFALDRCTAMPEGIVAAPAGQGAASDTSAATPAAAPESRRDG